MLLLAFPLWSSSRSPLNPPRSRLPELLAAASAVPTVIVQGTRDRMGAPDEIAVGLADAGIVGRVVPVPGADHSFLVPARGPLSEAAALDLIIRSARATALGIVDGQY